MTPPAMRKSYGKSATVVSCAGFVRRASERSPTHGRIPPRESGWIALRGCHEIRCGSLIGSKQLATKTPKHSAAKPLPRSSHAECAENFCALCVRTVCNFGDYSAIRLCVLCGRTCLAMATRCSGNLQCPCAEIPGELVTPAVRLISVQGIPLPSSFRFLGITRRSLGGALNCLVRSIRCGCRRLPVSDAPRPRYGGALHR